MSGFRFTTTIAKPREDVFDQLADVPRNGEWSPGFTGAQRVTPGPIGVGTVYATTAQGVGRRTIRGNTADLTRYLERGAGADERSLR